MTESTPGGPEDLDERPDREALLLRLTGDICDGKPIDWDAELKRAPELQGLFRQLALLERIRRSARERPHEGGDDGKRA